MNSTLLTVDSLRDFPYLLPFRIKRKDLILIRGSNGSGKTRMGMQLARKLFIAGNKIQWHKNVKISFSSHTADTVSFHYSNYYYQQRYNAFDDTKVRTVSQFLRYDPGNTAHTELLTTLLPISILNKRLTEISSGETRKVLLLRNVIQPADLYILDQPYTGLDKTAHYTVSQLLQKLVAENSAVIVMGRSVPDSLPITKEIELGRGSPLPDEMPVFNVVPATNHAFDIAFSIKHQDVYAGPKLLIRDIDWTIRRGEKWLLTGENGSGKTTLMSLIHADNPMAYALKIILFDRLRGTGESIWDIKKKIGFISPEIQLYWKPNVPVRKIVLSGFTGTMYSSRSLTPDEQDRATEIMEQLDIKAWENKPFGQLSTGQRRIVTIARALVQNPPFMILDEPFQGLDDRHFSRIHSLFRQMSDPSRTIIQIAHLDREILPDISHQVTIRDQRLRYEPWK